MSGAEGVEFPKIISVDDHVVEPPHVFKNYLPARLRSHPNVPRVERKGIASMTYRGGTKYDIVYDESAPKADCWFYEDLVQPHKRHVAAVGFERDDMGLLPITYDEMRPGCYEPKARLDDMDLNWVEASLCFPTMPRFCGQTFAEASDKDLALGCVQAYNDWMVEEWCGDSGGRLIPLIIIPLWDVELAIAEIERNASGVFATFVSQKFLQSSACRRCIRVTGIDYLLRVLSIRSPSTCTSVRPRRCRRHRPTPHRLLRRP
jgi:Amidohydrolase